MKKFNSDSRFEKDFVGLIEKIRKTGEISLSDTDFDYLPTLRCNMKCELCYQKHTREQNKESITNEMSFEQFKQAFDKLDVEGKIVKFIGGEPFVRKDLFDMFQYFKDRGAYNIIGTNSFVITPEIVKKLKSMNLVEVTTSIDGLGETHNKIRGGEFLFEKVAYFSSEMAKTHKVLLETVIQKGNLKELKKLIHLKIAWNIYKYRFQMPMFATKDKLKQTRNQLGDQEIDAELSFLDEWEYDFTYKAFLRAYDELRKQGIEFTTHPPFLSRDLVRCYKKNVRDYYNVYCTYLFRVRIEPDGMIRLCPFLIKFFGDLKKQSLGEIWNSKDYKEFRKKLLANNLTPLCESCAHMRILDGKEMK